MFSNLPAYFNIKKIKLLKLAGFDEFINLGEDNKRTLIIS